MYPSPYFFPVEKDVENNEYLNQERFERYDLSNTVSGSPYIQERKVPEHSHRADQNAEHNDDLEMGEIAALRQRVAVLEQIVAEQDIRSLQYESLSRKLSEYEKENQQQREFIESLLKTTQLQEKTCRHLQQIQSLYAIDQAITTNIDVQPTLQVVLEQVIAQLCVDAVTILLFNPVTQHLEHAASRGFHSPLIQRTNLRSGEGYAGLVAQERRMLCINNIAEETFDIRHALFHAEGITTYYGVPLIARDDIKGVLEAFHRVPTTTDEEWLRFLNILAGQTAIAIEHAELFAELQRTNDELLLAYDSTIEGLARALELRDAETQGHCRRVTNLVLKLAKAMGYCDEDIIHIRRGALLHDIGKMAIPDAILLKPGALTKTEQAIMQLHTTYAHDMLKNIPFLQNSIDIPFSHHEKWDGTGYPLGLKGEEIPLAARMFAVVDVYDALSSDRPYRKAWTKEHVRDYLLQQSGKHFDPHVVEIFLTAVLKYQ